MNSATTVPMATLLYTTSAREASESCRAAKSGEGSHADASEFCRVAAHYALLSGIPAAIRSASRWSAMAEYHGRFSACANDTAGTVRFHDE